MNWEELIRHYGYYILFLGTLLEGETIVIVAGFFARRGYLDLWWVILISFTGTFLADQTLFQIGRVYGPAVLRRWPTVRKAVHRAWRLLGRLQNTYIFGSRFLYGLRTATPLALGAAGVKTSRFVLLNGSGAVVWSVLFPLVGYSIGVALETLVERVKQYELIVTGVLLAAAAVALVVYWLRLRKQPNGEIGDVFPADELPVPPDDAPADDHRQGPSAS